ncbi:MAG: carboxypeptidase-like regulatory domain-containing protein [Bacteroidales bacterium]|nr:carboxypeptidase-like regulatory domain-containing protein [Bacteroidales bacterium]
MKKLLTSFFALTLSFGVFAQNVSGYVKSENGEGVPFVSIYLKEKNIGITSNIDGHYILPNSILAETNDTLIFSSIGFETQKISVPLFKQRTSAGKTNIVLKTNSISLPEVVITANAHQPKDYGLFHLQTAHVKFHGDCKVMVFVENTDDTDKIIRTVNIRFGLGDTNEIVKYRVFFYQKTEVGFQNIKVADHDIFITDISQQEIRHDVSKYRIPFPKEGIYVGVERIEIANVIRDRSIGKKIGLKGTTKAGKSYSWMFDEKEDEWFLLTLENFEKKVLKEGESIKKDVPLLYRGYVRNLIRRTNFQIGITAY